MASDQIDYCGDCKHYVECTKLASEGRLSSCKLNASANTSK